MFPKKLNPMYKGQETGDGLPLFHAVSLSSSNFT